MVHRSALVLKLLTYERGDRCCPHDQPAGGYRRGAQLGLPLHVDP
jgi:hypothetical protein